MKIFISGTISTKTIARNQRIASILEGSTGLTVYLPQNYESKDDKLLFLNNLTELKSSDVLLLLGDTFSVCSASEIGYMAALGKMIIVYIEYQKSLYYLRKHLMIKNLLNGLITSNKNVLHLVQRSTPKWGIEALYVKKENLGLGLKNLISKITREKSQYLNQP